MGNTSKPMTPGDTISAYVARGVFEVFSETAQPVANNVQTTLGKLNIVLDNLAKNSSRLDTIFIRLENTPYYINRTLSTSNEKIELLSTSFKQTADNLSSTLRDLRPVIKNFSTFSDSLKRLELNETLQKTQETLAGLTATLAKLSDGDNTASKLMTEDSLYVNLNKLLLDLDTLAVNFNNNPKHFLAPLGKSAKKIEKDRRKMEEEN